MLVQMGAGICGGSFELTSDYYSMTCAMKKRKNKERIEVFRKKPMYFCFSELHYSQLSIRECSNSEYPHFLECRN